MIFEYLDKMVMFQDTPEGLTADMAWLKEAGASEYPKTWDAALKLFDSLFVKSSLLLKKEKFITQFFHVCICFRLPALQLSQLRFNIL